MDSLFFLGTFNPEKKDMQKELGIAWGLSDSHICVALNPRRSVLLLQSPSVRSFLRCDPRCNAAPSPPSLPEQRLTAGPQPPPRPGPQAGRRGSGAAAPGAAAVRGCAPALLFVAVFASVLGSNC